MYQALEAMALVREGKLESPTISLAQSLCVMRVMDEASSSRTRQHDGLSLHAIVRVSVCVESTHEAVSRPHTLCVVCVRFVSLSDSGSGWCVLPHGPSTRVGDPPPPPPPL
jgi:hypothetical protein